MALCQFADGAGMYDVTPIENMFLLEFLPTAPDGFLRVYLYMRMLALHPELGETVEDVAKALRMERDAVLHAMEYWERQGLVCRLSDQPPAFSFLSVHASGALNPMDNDYYEYRDFNASLQAMFGAELLSPKHYGMAYDWVTLYHFTQEAALRMVEARVSRSKGKNIKPDWAFKKLDEQARTWSERGVRTLEDVEKALVYDERIDRTAKAVLKQLAIKREPSVEEQKLTATWLDEWGYTHEQILEACAETTKARNPTMAYLNSILENGRQDRNDVFRAVQSVLHILNPYESAPSEPQMDAYRQLIAEGFEPQTVLLAATRCRNSGRLRFDDLTRMLGKWRKEGLFRCDAAEAYLQERDQVFGEVRALLQKAGTDRSPRLFDLNMYEEWKTLYPAELIGYAAECAHGMEKPMLYINKRLEEWTKGGARTVEEASALQQSRPQYAGRPAAAQNPALNYEQRKYTEEDFADLFVDLEREYGEGSDEA